MQSLGNIVDELDDDLGIDIGGGGLQRKLAELLPPTPPMVPGLLSSPGVSRSVPQQSMVQSTTRTAHDTSGPEPVLVYFLHIRKKGDTDQQQRNGFEDRSAMIAFQPCTRLVGCKPASELQKSLPNQPNTNAVSGALLTPVRIGAHATPSSNPRTTLPNGGTFAAGGDHTLRSCKILRLWISSDTILLGTLRAKSGALPPMRTTRFWACARSPGDFRFSSI